MTTTDAAVAELNFEGWTPPGAYDDANAVWYTDRNVTNSFPDSGVEVFDQVDESSFWFAHRNQMIEQMLRRNDISGSFLEVGSGSGVVAAHLASVGRTVAAVEPIESGALRAAERGVTLSFCGDLESLQLPDASVPAIGMFDVIEHIETPGALLAETLRVLQPGGALLITVPAHQWLWSDFDVWNGHYRRYTKATLEHELTAAGFAVIENSYFFLPLLLPAAVSRVVVGKLRAARSKQQIEEDLASDLSPGSPVVDRILRAVHKPELAALGKVPVPTGTSLIALARKDSTS